MSLRFCAIARVATPVLAAQVLLVPVLVGQTASIEGPNYTSAGELVRPTDYREWIFLTSGLGMTYGAAGAQRQPPRFDNVFVIPAAYRTFLQTGRWPEGTMFILEIRNSTENASINNGGFTQGDVVAVEASVKDSSRNPDSGWAYYNFGGGQNLVDSVAPLAQTARCYACHGANTAVDNTFVQFYPTLFEAAQRHGTVRPDYDPARKVQQ